MGITLLHFEDCPNWKVADERLTAIAAERADIRLTSHLVETPAEAERIRSGLTEHPGRSRGRVRRARLRGGALLSQVPDTGWVRGAPTLDQLRAVLADA